MRFLILLRKSISIMITVKKLFTLDLRHRYRKACQILELIEADFRNTLNAFMRDRPSDLSPNLSSNKQFTKVYNWLQEFIVCASSDQTLNEFDTCKLIVTNSKVCIETLASRTAIPDAHQIETAIRCINTLRRSLEAQFGRAPADWDFFAPLGTFSGQRRYFKEVRVFLEDVRSPYNVGSIFRTADACGFDEVLLSNFTANPCHPRAQRTAMGACTIVPWHRVSLKDLTLQDTMLLGVELGGTSLDSFEFPNKGTLLLGSEELGLSPEARALCTKLISIPMLGAKGSLNVSVAFGIVANAWRASLMHQGIEPISSNETAMCT